MNIEEKCDRCRGCGLIASSDDGEPWSVWLDMPLGSSAAVLMGLIFPLPCPECAPRVGDIVHGRDGKNYLIDSVQTGARNALGYIASQVEFRSASTLLQFNGWNLKIVKRREERVAERLME